MDWPTKIDSLSVCRTGKEFPQKVFFLSDIIFLFRNLPCPVKDKYSVMAGWPPWWQHFLASVLPQV
jgi:hypothetical protein